jgi:hypothetical protein
MTVVALAVSTLPAVAQGLDLGTWESKTPSKPELPTALNMNKFLHYFVGDDRTKPGSPLARLWWYTWQR